jgi:phage repressor protein C with HTH and peptisase S24 domain
MDYPKQLEILMERLEVNQTGLAKLLGVSRGIISEFSNGSREPSKDFIFGISKLGISTDWFLTGNGEVFRQVSADSNVGPSEPFSSPSVATQTAVSQEFSMVQFRRGVPMEISTDENDPNGVVLLPLFNQRSAAGPGQEVLDRVEVETLVPVVREILGHRSPKDCGVVRVVGDSMAEIQLNNGDRAIFDRSDVEGDGVFVITHNGAVRIKRLQYRFDVKRVFIKSENRRYPDVEEEPLEAIGSTLRIEGKVIGWLHRHLY